MAAVTICSDFGTKKIKSVTVSITFPSICHEVMGPDAMILAEMYFLMGPRSPDQGVIRASFFQGLSLWLADGHLPGVLTWFFLCVCVCMCALISIFFLRTPVTLD